MLIGWMLSGLRIDNVRVFSGWITPWMWGWRCRARAPAFWRPPGYFPVRRSIVTTVIAMMRRSSVKEMLRS